MKCNMISAGHAAMAAERQPCTDHTQLSSFGLMPGQKESVKEGFPGVREPDQKPVLQPVGPQRLCGRYHDYISNNKQEKARGEIYEIYN